MGVSMEARENEEPARVAARHSQDAVGAASHRRWGLGASRHRDPDRAVDPAAAKSAGHLNRNGAGVLTLNPLPLLLIENHISTVVYTHRSTSISYPRTREPGSIEMAPSSKIVPQRVFPIPKRRQKRVSKGSRALKNNFREDRLSAHLHFARHWFDTNGS